MKKLTGKPVSLFFSILLILFLGGFAFAAEEKVATSQEDFDDVFDNPEEDVVLEQPKDVDYRTQFEKNEKIVVKGDFVARAGGGMGWDDTPFKDEAEMVAGAYAKATLSFDARPDPSIRIFGKLKTEMDSDNGNDIWSMIEFDELYCDYNVADKAFLRLGRFYMTWGQGRLFRPGNFMEDCEDGTAFRLNLPTVLDGVSFVTLYKQRHPITSGDKKLHKDDLSYAGHVDKTLGPINLSAAMLYNSADGEKYSGSFKTNIWHIDFFSDYVLTHVGDDSIYEEGDILHEALGGFYREWSDVKIYGEYYYDGRIKDDPDHCVGAAANINNLFGSPVTMSFKWLHSINKENGQFIGGFSISPWKHITIRAAVPWHYGDEELDKDFYEEFPIKSKLAFTLFVELQSGF